MAIKRVPAGWVLGTRNTIDPHFRVEKIVEFIKPTVVDNMRYTTLHVLELKHEVSNHCLQLKTYIHMPS